ncbi:MsnO8 family LLM class oxidoreductase [Corynebacterium sp. A21]|uniref:MsnO8 family LLM class oxidoreductase n=1 Tax=Corynebacterium sp. A21 TaxID=3457318 RepID=UPI003FD13A2F
MASELRLSILDRANIRTGGESPDAAALRAVVDRAIHTENLGFERFLVAEHHGVPGIAGSTPTLLATAVAAATTTIRVGTAGIMLPAHPPLVVAEQILTLAALFPGRIDAGIGRSLGFTPGVRGALRQSEDAAERFPADLAELLDFLQGAGAITARPQVSATPPVYVLANSRSIHAAAEAGLGVIVGGPKLFDRSGSTHEGLAKYRKYFRPSALLSQPQAIIAANIAVAETTAQARQLLLPEAWALAMSRKIGSFEALRPAAELDLGQLRDRDRERVEHNIEGSIYGTPDEVDAQLAELIEFTGVSEVVATGGMQDLSGQAHSDELLAGLL